MIKQIIPISLTILLRIDTKLLQYRTHLFRRSSQTCNIDIKQAQVLLQLFWRITLRVDRDEYDLQIIFITVDPERDTPEQLKQYLSLFDVNVTGLTGSPEKVRSVLQQFGIYAQKNGQGDGDYLFDHSSAVFLYRDDGSCHHHDIEILRNYDQTDNPHLLDHSFAHRYQTVAVPNAPFQAIQSDL